MAGALGWPRGAQRAAGSRSARGALSLSRSVAGIADGQPRWLATVDTALASALGRHGALVSWAFAAVLAVLAAAVFLPVPARRAVLGAGAVLAVAVWTLGQGFGGLLTGMATDPNSGPLLLLAVAAYWPVHAATTARAPATAPRAPAAAPWTPAAAAWTPAAAAPVPAADGPLRAGESGTCTRSWVRRDIDVMNVLMAIAMASMLAGRLNPVLEVVWLVTFAAASAWFAGHAARVWFRHAGPGSTSCTCSHAAGCWSCSRRRAPGPAR